MTTSDDTPVPAAAQDEEIGDPVGKTTYNPDDPESGLPDPVEGRAATPARACRNALAEATQRWRGRNRASDGIMGDRNHCPGSSDHCTGNAFDLTHDPVNGCDAHALAEGLKQRIDPRVKYVISNARIWNPSIAPGWRTYSGANPHTSHAHVSIHGRAREDSAPWWDAPPPPVHPPFRGSLRRGVTGDHVRQWQAQMRARGWTIGVDGIYGVQSERVCRAFQAEKGLRVDGIVGPFTWTASWTAPVT